jgi:hypothetical protein
MRLAYPAGSDMASSVRMRQLSKTTWEKMLGRSGMRWVMFVEVFTGMESLNSSGIHRFAVGLC